MPPTPTQKQNNARNNSKPYACFICNAPHSQPWCKVPRRPSDKIASRIPNQLANARRVANHAILRSIERNVFFTRACCDASRTFSYKPRWCFICRALTAAHQFCMLLRGAEAHAKKRSACRNRADKVSGICTMMIGCWISIWSSGDTPPPNRVATRTARCACFP